METRLDRSRGDRRMDRLAPLSGQVAGILAEVSATERRVLRWLYGLGCELLSAEEIAFRMGMSEAEVWTIGDHAIAVISRLVLQRLELELAA